jgi:hypothetical protein
MAKKKQSDKEKNAVVIPAAEGELLLYQTEDGLSRIEARLHQETVWLTQNQLVELFQTTKPTITISTSLSPSAIA